MFLAPAIAQEEKSERIVLYATMLDGDTIPVIMLPELKIFSFRPYESRRAERKMTRLIRNVKRVYPYAKLAGIKLNEYEEILAGVEDKKKAT